MRIALAQINPTLGDFAGNQKKILDYVAQAKKQKADVVAFPELAICGYPPEDLLHKDHFVQDNLKALRFLAKEIKNITAIIGFVDQDKKKDLYNAAAIIQDGQLNGIYHKQELPNYGVFDEKRYFVCGKKDFIFSIGGTRIGVNICEDIWVKETKGVDVLINISSSPYDMGKFKEREELLKKRAKQMKAFVGYANLVGGQDELVFDGASLILNPKGNIVASAKQFKEDLVVADLGGAKILSPKPLIQVEQIYQALVLGTRDYIRKNGFKKVVIGLSGGIDSALVAAIATKAIGKDNVIGVSMPSQFTSDGTKSDAKILANNLWIEFKEIPIEDVFAAYTTTLQKEFKGLKPNIAEENIQARIRGNLLMALSNKFGWLVLTTGNKSEVAVGYCTLYGDMSGGFAVIKDVPKTKVYELARFVNSKSPLIPESVLERAPTAELRANQKDQDSLPDYDTLDALLESYVEHHRSFAAMSRDNNKELVKKVIQMVDKSEYKRRQAPPGVKITQRAFGRDWRLPITNHYKEF